MPYSNLETSDSMNSKPSTIVCTACGAETVLKYQPTYDDSFKRVGETLTCSACGHEYASEEEVPYKHEERPDFLKDEPPRRPVIFHDNEKGTTCHYCKHYVVNPFTQRCSVKRKEVEATDSCTNFESKKKS